MTAAQAYGGARHALSCARAAEDLDDLLGWLVAAMVWRGLARKLRRTA